MLNIGSGTLAYSSIAMLTAQGGSRVTYLWLRRLQYGKQRLIMKPCRRPLNTDSFFTHISRCSLVNSTIRTIFTGVRSHANFGASWWVFTCCALMQNFKVKWWICTCLALMRNFKVKWWIGTCLALMRNFKVKWRIYLKTTAVDMSMQVPDIQ